MFLVFFVAIYEIVFTRKVLKSKLISAATRFHMQVHFKYLTSGAVLLVWLEAKMLTDGDVLEPITALFVWLGLMIHHLHGESSAALRGDEGLDLRRFGKEK